MTDDELRAEALRWFTGLDAEQRRLILDNPVGAYQAGARAMQARMMERVCNECGIDASQARTVDECRMHGYNKITRAEFEARQEGS
jgi:hypothetical protein